MWKPLRLVPLKTNFDFLGKRKIALILSTVVNLLSILAVVFIGLNFGIDFQGGIAIQARAKQGAAQIDQLRSTVGGLGLGEVALQEFGEHDSRNRYHDKERRDGGNHGRQVVTNRRPDAHRQGLVPSHDKQGHHKLVE